MCWLALLCATRAAEPAAPTALKEPAHDALILEALSRMDRGAYDSADSLLRTLPDIPARGYFRGLALAARCEDLGDTAALREAETEWSSLERAGDGSSSPLTRDPNYAAYRGLAGLQLSYVASRRGSRIKAARLARRAAKRLGDLPGMAEAEAATALYDYYQAELLEGVGWLPFVKADREGPLRRLEAAVPRSRYLRATLSASLFWIYYDSRRYREGLAGIRGFLSSSPGNRMWRQMLADFHFRSAPEGSGSLDSALAIHQALELEYRDLGRTYPPPAYLPLGYLCSIGNLVKIHAARGERAEARARLNVWDASVRGGLKSWLPASLVREVEALRKEKLRPE